MAARSSRLTDPLELPCGLKLSNRLGRAAMTEGLSDSRNDATDRHTALYAANASGGAGLVLTGNVMVDRRHLERARNIVVDAATDRTALRRVAEVSKLTPTLVQVAHPGRQTNRVVQPKPVGPSDGPAVKLGGAFAKPRALTLAEIAEVRHRFIDTSLRVVDAGFPGVTIHGAHGYLLSSFTDPKFNRRTDAYGGELEGRARLTREVVSDLREALPADAAVAVKLDARDGAWEELVQLSLWLQEDGVDLIEVSGGNYEKPRMVGYDGGGTVLESEHESPFWEACALVSEAVDVPVMLTGGFRTRAEVDRALETGVCDMVGVGRPLAVDPSLAGRFIRRETDTLERPAPRLGGPKTVRSLLGAPAGAGWHRIQLGRTGDGKAANRDLKALTASLDYMLKDMAQAATARRSRMRLAAQTPPPSPPEGSG